MKVLIVIPYLASIYGGPAKVVQELAQNLGNLDVSVDLITTDANGDRKLEVPHNIWIERKGYRVQYFDCWHKNDFIVSGSLICWLLQHVKSYDLVHTHHRFAPLVLAAEWVCQIRHVPYIATPHGMLEPWALTYKAWKKRLYYHLLERPALRQARAIHALNSSEASNIQALGFQQTIVVSNGIYPQKFEKLPSPKEFYRQFPKTYHKTLILFLGRIDPKKGLDLLAPAFAEIRRHFPNVHLAIAGPDSIGYRPTVETYFAQQHCLNAVTFTGMLVGSLKYSALAAADFYVAPSYSEGFSLSILEGMASGLPCVITTECNFPEAAANQAAYVVPPSSDAIAHALIGCIHRPIEAQQTGDRAREFVFQYYTWERSARNLLRAYSKVLNYPELKQSKLSEIR